MNPKEVLQFCKDKKVVAIDLKFVDMPGTWQHFTVPVDQLDERSFADGFGFDGSSIRGWQAINESDMLVIPDAASAFLDPFSAHTTLSMICDIQDPITRKAYSRDPRQVARRAVEHMKKIGIADTCYCGPELEFFVFDSARFDQGMNFAHYEIESSEGLWTRGRPGDGNKGYQMRAKEGYFPVPPSDSMQDLRTEMVETLRSIGIEVEAHHHEVGNAGQAEIDMKYRDLVRMADQVMMYKYVLKNVASRHGKTVTFMPKPLFQDNGTGMHTHISLWKGEKPLFAGERYAGLSDLAWYAAGGIIQHAHALLGFCAPTTNSYRRLVPGYEAPVNLMLSQRNRSAALRIPMYSANPKAKRIEFRCPDPSANPYLAFSAILCAAIDGIQNKIEPPAPIDKDLYDLEPEEAEKIASTPGSLEEALDALARDHAFLVKPGVFTQDLIDTWLDYKRKREFDQVRLRPHPYEFVMYFDC
ncbi:MAG: type I glutamate--ammonia ligase [Planctomycetes bacterium]|nr:type I glutamate--ammonia ligase [Planctomycetota bacterium]